jgi:hypothetical protein
MARPRIEETALTPAERKRRQRAKIIALRQIFYLKTPDGRVIRRLKLFDDARKTRAEMESQRYGWQWNAPQYDMSGLLVTLELEKPTKSTEIGIPKNHKGVLRSWNKVQYGSGFHRRGWRDDESGTDNETGDVRLSDEINTPLDSHRVGRTERAIEKVDKVVDYDDDASIGSDYEATIEAARLNKHLAKKLAKQRRVVDVTDDNDDQPDMSVYDLKTEKSRRFGDDSEVTARDVKAITAGDASETETDIEDAPTALPLAA